MSKYLQGMHEWCPLGIMPDGTVLYIAELGDSTVPHQGIDLSNEPRTVMIRFQWLFGVDGGCYPPPALQAGFIQRVESLVRNTPSCHLFVGGNEPNIKTEGMVTPEYAAEMYDAIRTAVHAQPGHEGDVVLLPPVGPWNTEIGYGWIVYFMLLIEACGTVDGFALHTYSRGSAPSSIWSEDKMDPPYQHLHNGFRTYRDWMAAIPAIYRDLPCYITETDQNEAWLDELSTWVQTAYAEIDDWNKTPGNQQIRSLLLYRWPPYDRYYIAGKQHVIDDFKLAQAHGYEWTEEDQPMALTNGGFELPYIVVPGHDNCRVAWDWQAWAKTTQPDDVDPGEAGDCAYPEYKPITLIDDPTRVPEGEASQCWFLTSKRMNAGIMQRVAVGTGNTCLFKAQVETWCSDSDDPYTDDGEMYARLIIDPTGGYDPEAARVVRGDWHRATAEYEGIDVLAVAEANSVTVFVQFWNKWRMKHNDAYVGKAELIVTGGQPSEPPEPPPPTGTWQVAVIDPAGNVVVAAPFEVSSADAQVNALAQQIVDLTR